MGGTLTAASGGRNCGATISFAIPLLQQESAPPGSSSAAAAMLQAPHVSAAAAAPAAREDSAAGASQALQRPTAARDDDDNAPRAPLRVLVAEDDALCAAVMRKMLERLGGIAGTIVGDGVAAVAAYECGALCAASSRTE
jgi:hypothetical protein